MDIERFWAVIEDAHQASNGNLDKQVKLMIETLTNLSADEIQEFDRIVWSLMTRAYRTDIWEAAWLVACGCGDDAFHDFRNWLISQGQTIYEKVLENPENLADFVDKNQRFNIFEGWMSSVASLAYEQKIKQHIPKTGYRETPILIGGTVDLEGKLPSKFPRIIDKIGGCDDETIFT